MSIFKLFVGAAGLALATATITGATAQDQQPDVRLARDLVAAASAFETFAGRAAAIEPAFTDAASVAQALRVGAGHEARQLQSGMTAYAAMAALQEPAFVAGVRRAAREEGVDAVARRMHERPDLALHLPGAEAAAARAAAALAAQAEPLRTSGAQVKQAAYDVQAHAWSKAFVPNAAGRLAKVKQISAESFSPTDADGLRLLQTVAIRHSASPAPAGPTIQRALALAALALLDRAGEADAAAVKALAEEPGAASCLRIAKLNLFQCVAVAGPHYEDVFCLGEHAMLEPARCVAKAAGTVVAPAELAPTVVARAGQ